MLGLAVSVAVAMLFPEWYCEWQDQKRMESVTLTSREAIEFLDTESLDIAGRMQLLSQTETLTWLEYTDSFFMSDQEIESLLKRCQAAVERWCGCGLVPEECADWAKEEYAEYGRVGYIYADQSAFQVFILRFKGPDANTLTCVLDAEKDMLYYISYASEKVQDDIGLELGYESFDDFIICMEQGDFPREVQADYSGYEFASLCGAEQAVVQGQPGYPELIVELSYDNFTGYVFRNLVGTDQAVGVAYMLGTTQWRNVVSEMMESAGYWEGPFDVQEYYDTHLIQFRN